MAIKITIRSTNAAIASSPAFPTSNNVKQAIGFSQNQSPKYAEHSIKIYLSLFSILQSTCLICSKSSLIDCVRIFAFSIKSSNQFFMTKIMAIPAIPVLVSDEKSNIQLVNAPTKQSIKIIPSFLLIKKLWFRSAM